MPSVRSEITRTLQRLGRRLASQPGVVVPRTAGHARSRKLPRSGTQFGNYRIEKHIGAGGMGHVLRATDTVLGRPVALKFLSPELAGNEEMLRRLLQEARTASRLNHSNILTIYEVGQRDGFDYIASEFIEGRTLRARLQEGALAIPEIVDIACQIAQALIAAHRFGIIHRDLKPGNIMLRPDGVAKVIDFGLAKQTERGTNSQLLEPVSITQPGTIAGTFNYMSPEQAGGEKLDHRTDLWSFGVILYEMLSGRRPFEGSTDNHVIVNILDHPLPASPELDRKAPELMAIIRRALAKKREERYGSAGEMLDDLTTVPLGMGSTVRFANPVAPRPRRRMPRIKLLATLLIASLVACGVWFARKHTWFPDRPISLELIRQVTFSGEVQVQAFSPDGRYLAYVTGSTDGFQTLYIKQISTGAEEQRLPPQRTRYEGLTFAPDSQSLYVVQKDRRSLGRLYSLPLFGNATPHLVLVDIDGPVSFSPDGSRFAFVRYLAPAKAAQQHRKGSLEIARRDGSQLQPRYISTDENLFRRPAWSGTSDQIALFAIDMSDQLEALRIAPAGSVVSTPLAGWRQAGQLAWLPQTQSLLTTAAESTENQTQIRQLDLKSGRSWRLTHDLSGYTQLSLNANASQLTAIRTESKSRVWVSSPHKWTAGTLGGAESQSYPTVSWLDGEQLIVNARRDRYQNLWLLGADTQARNPLTDEPSVEQSAVSVPGTRQVVLSSNRDGRFHLWHFDPQTNEYRPLTSGLTYDERPSVTPDGAWVYYTAWTGNVPHISRVPTAGGTPSQVGSLVAKDVQVSPDGQRLLLYYQDPQSMQWRLGVSDREPTSPPEPISFNNGIARWYPNGESVVVAVTDQRNVSNLWSVPLKGSKPRQITAFDEGQIADFAWSPGGERLACLRMTSGSDAVLFEVHKP